MIISGCVDHMSNAVLQICVLILFIKLGQPDWLLYNTPRRLADGKLTQYENSVGGGPYSDLSI